MAKSLDLEEQEQLDQLKHFWKQYGNPITWALTLVLLAFAGWNGYQYWEQRQARQSAAMFDELERIAGQSDIALLERAFNDMKAAFPRTVFTHQGALLTARALNEAGKPAQAGAVLTWLIQSPADEGYKAIARLRLAGVLAASKDYDQALAQLQAPMPPAFAGLVADRKGDVLFLQGNTSAAKAAYELAYKELGDRVEYRRVVEIKLNALGVDPQPQPAQAAAPTPGASQ